MATLAPNRDRYAGESFVSQEQISAREPRVCPACDCGESRQLGVKNDLPIVSCVGCGTRYTPYRPWYSSQEFYSGYYPVISAEPQFIKQRLAETIKEFDAYRKTNRLLDLGCGTGALLQAAQDKAWDAQGLDVSEPVVARGQELGLKVTLSELRDAQFPEGYFDVVTASELLEHLPEPQLLVREVWRVLREGGLFWTTTPNGVGVSGRVLGLKWSVLSPPEHLQLFSLRGVKKLFSMFSSISVKTEATNPYELWNGLRHSRSELEQSTEKCDRVQTSYRLNEALLKSPLRKTLKRAANGVLNLSRLGDSLQIQAFR